MLGTGVTARSGASDPAHLLNPHKSTVTILYVVPEVAAKEITTEGSQVCNCVHGQQVVAIITDIQNFVLTNPKFREFHKTTEESKEFQNTPNNIYGFYL